MQLSSVIMFAKDYDGLGWSNRFASDIIVYK
jgi:hypothetical protein